MTRRGRLFGGILATLAALCAVLVLSWTLFDWNRLKPYVNARVSEAIGRPFAIRGDVDVAWRRAPDATGWRRWLPWPEFTARDVTVANPDWARVPRLASLQALRFRLSPLALLAHRIEVPMLTLVQPRLDLERDARGRASWQFALPAGDDAGGWTLALGAIGFDRGRVHVDDAATKTALDITVTPLAKAEDYRRVVAENAAAAQAQARDTVGAGGGKAVAGEDAADDGDAAHDRAAQATRYAFAWRAQGRYQGAPAHGSGRIGAVLDLQRADRPFPLQARVQVGDTHIGLAGTLTDPLQLGALDLHLWFAGTSMARLYPLLGITLPDTRPYATRGRLRATLGAHGSRFSYRHFRGRVGASDLAGDLGFVTGGARPRLTGALRSQRLVFGDLAPLIGAGGGSDNDDASPPPPGKLLPVAPFRTDRWRAMDADVRFTAARIEQLEALPIQALSTHLVMEDGQLTLDPLRVGLAGGELRGKLALDGRTTPMRGHAALGARHVQLKALFPGVEAMRRSLGEINGRSELTAQGNSVAALLGSADGRLTLLMNDGAISKNLLETAGLNVGNIILGKLFGDRPVQINCAAADLAARHGVFGTRLAVFDTDDAVIRIDGTVDFGDETLDLDIKPQTKGLRILSLRSPLYVRGTLKQPDVGVQAGPLALRAGGAVALGALAAPAAALLALVSPDRDSTPDTCRQVLRQLRDAAPAKAAKP